MIKNIFKLFFAPKTAKSIVAPFLEVIEDLKESAEDFRELQYKREDEAEYILDEAQLKATNLKLEAKDYADEAKECDEYLKRIQKVL